MIERLVAGVLDACDRLLTDTTSVNQVRALQLMFDLKFLANILAASTHDDSQVSVTDSVFTRWYLPSKKLSDEVLMWLSVWSEVQTVCIWSS